MKSSQVSGLWAQGKYAEAQRSSNAAKVERSGARSSVLVVLVICGILCRHRIRSSSTPAPRRRRVRLVSLPLRLRAPLLVRRRREYARVRRYGSGTRRLPAGSCLMPRKRFSALTVRAAVAYG